MGSDGDEIDSVKKTKELLKLDGIIVSDDQAKSLTEFFKILAVLVIDEYLNTSK